MKSKLNWAQYMTVVPKGLNLENNLVLKVKFKSLYLETEIVERT